MVAAAPRTISATLQHVSLIHRAALLVICCIFAASAAVQTYEGPPVIKEQPVGGAVRRNDPYTLNCAAPDASQIKWFHDGKPIDVSSDRLLLPNGSLFFLRVATTKKVSDEGTYWCVAINSVGSTRSVNATIQIAFIGDDFLISPEKVVKIVAGDELTLPCRPPRGNPTPQLVWLRNGISLQNSTRVYIFPSGDLRLLSARAEDSGSYECQAVNLAGTKTSLPSELTVMDSPRFVIQPVNQTVTSGATLSLPCQASGYPTPKVDWLRSGGKMPLARTSVTSEKTLIISMVSSSDTGQYACVAESEAGSISTEVYIKVLALPNFKERSSDQVLQRGSSKQLPCSLDGDPPPILMWRLPGDDPSNILLLNHENGHKKVSNDGSLLIRDIQLDDSGLYSCLGTNSGGGVITRSRILAIEAFPPPVVGIAPRDQVISDGDTVTLPCEPASEASEPKVSWWYRPAAHLPEHEILENSDTGITLSGNVVLTIRNATRTSNGIYTCRIEAETGKAEATALLRYEDVSHMYKDNRNILPAPPSKPKIRLINDTSVRLSWQPNSSQAGVKYPLRYMVEYWRHGWTEWRIAATNIRSENTIIVGLSRNSTYTFLVRSITGSDQSFPSPWSNPIRPEVLVNNSIFPKIRWNSDRRFEKQNTVLINASTVTSRSVLLTWQGLDETNQADGMLVYWISHEAPNNEGFRSPSKVNVATVLGGSSSSHLVQNLESYAYYTFFLVPFWESVEGTPTNSLSLLTPEAIPSTAPSTVSLIKKSSTTALLTWDEVRPGQVPGHLLGYSVVASCNGTVTDHNVTVPWILLSYPSSRCLLTSRVAAMTSVGIGPFSTPVILQMDGDETTLNFNSIKPVDRDSATPPSLMWILYLLVSLLLLIIIGLALYLRGYVSCEKCPNRTTQGKCCDHSVCSSHCRVNIYGDQHKTWSSTDTPRLQPNECLLRNNHYVNDYAEPNNLIGSDISNVDAYTTTALMGPTSPHHEISGVPQWTAFQPPPPPSCPPPPLGQYSGSEGTTYSGSHSSNDSYNRAYPGRQCNRFDRSNESASLYNDGSCGGYRRPCDETSEHTYEVYNQKHPTGAHNGDLNAAVGYLEAQPIQQFPPSTSNFNFIKDEALSKGAHKTIEVSENIPLRRSPNDDLFPRFSSLHGSPINKIRGYN